MMENTKNQLLILLFATFLWSACTSAETAKKADDEKTANVAQSQPSNPPMEGFNEVGSDAKAIAIADEVMEAMGGRTAWDNTRFLSWNFFGIRRLTWDKFAGDVRIDQFKDQDLKILVNIRTGKGKVFKDGEELAQPDSIAKYLERGKRAWINDAYWLVMPYKLKDTGVTLTYEGEGMAQDSTPVDILQLTFEGVGVTPQNKYLVCIDKNTSLVCEWSYFPTADAEEPRFTIPWKDYQKHGSIMLSGNRGERQLTEIMVFDKLPETIFTSFEDIDLKGDGQKAG